MRTITKVGGSVIAGSANVLWGADFGESSDNNTFTAGVNLDLEAIAIENDKIVGVQVTMPELAIVYNNTIGVNIDIDDIAVENTKIVGVNLDLEDIGITNDKIVGVNVTMPELEIENNKTVGVHLSGSVRGAPFWQSIQITDSSTAGTSIVITKPVGMVVGDLMVALVGHNTNEVVTAPSGWVEIRQQGRTGVTLQCHLAAFYKIVVSGDSVLTNYTFTWTTSGAFFGSIQHFTATDASPINTSDATASSVTDPVAPALTTSSTNCFLIAACIQNSAIGLTYTPPAGYVERADQDGLGVAAAHLLDGEVATKVQAASGGVPAATMDSSTLVAVDSVAMHIAITSGLLVIAT